jgi:hypothetical protein
MTSQVVTKPVRITCSEKHVEGSVEVKYFSRELRLEKAIKTGVFCLLITALCILIPVAHFVLVPSGLILTPILALRQFRITNAIIGASLTCAACGGELTRLSSRENYPLYETCLSCKRENLIEPLQS